MATSANANLRFAVTTRRLAHEVNTHVRGWCVMHACEVADEVAAVVECQLAAGMKPYMVNGAAMGNANQTSSGHRAHSESLLTAWSEVREWRKRLTTPEMATFELVHAHAFPAGMAAVRTYPAVVYDLRSFVEAQASKPGQDFTWLARSFRVAEQFVIGRAGAVVVHSRAERNGVLERGAPEANVFQIPDPLDADWTELLRQKRLWARETRGEDIAFFAPDVCLREQDAPDLPQEAVHLLEAFTIICKEVPGARLFVQADSVCVQPLFEQAQGLGIAAQVHAISSDDRERALSEADVIIAVPGEQAEDTVVTGLLKRCAVLAADAPQTRDASSDGRGLLWYRAGDIRDLAYRGAFLAHNPDFRAALVEAGRSHLLETRSPEVIGRRYDAVYRHAWERRRSGSPSGGMNLQPLTACL
jgi:glycosyltransferase involved in cell wall biosynthesis